MVEVSLGYCKERESEVCDGGGGGEAIISKLVKVSGDPAPSKNRVTDYSGRNHSYSRALTGKSIHQTVFFFSNR